MRQYRLLPLLVLIFAMSACDNPSYSAAPSAQIADPQLLLTASNWREKRNLDFKGETDVSKAIADGYSFVDFCKENMWAKTIYGAAIRKMAKQASVKAKSTNCQQIWEKGVSKEGILTLSGVTNGFEIVNFFEGRVLYLDLSKSVDGTGETRRIGLSTGYYSLPYGANCEVDPLFWPAMQKQGVKRCLSPSNQ